ncbi:RrF2 family transcriptional regulator, partial [Micromonospora sp. NPDC047670]|uniref:RrF2 family transcriptional regulator n=1 Tax=Micromonospora sp. NPDC047670 TaxID=3364252 RepID=UPI0037171D7B
GARPAGGPPPPPPGGGGPGGGGGGGGGRPPPPPPVRLARKPAEITLLQIVEAVDGPSSPYECREIRQQGRGALPAEDCRNACILAAKMTDAHDAWRRSLAGVSLADILGELPAWAPERTRSLLTGARDAGSGRRGTPR